MGNEILVSIICPLYNKERYIPETITSLINQTYSNWELLIVDDGSTDNSIKIVNEFLSDKRIRLFERTNFKKNKGASVCRNIGINISKGSFLIFLDADDILKPNCLKNRLEYILKYPNHDFYVFNIDRFIGSIENTVPKNLAYYFEKIRYFTTSNKRKFITKKFLKYSTLWSICNCIWLRDSILKIGGFNEEFQRLQDPELHTRALLEGLDFKFLKYQTYPDVFVRNDVDRSSSINKKQMFKRVSSSLLLYINTIYPVLAKNNYKSYSKYLECYVILIEQMVAGYKHNTTDITEVNFYLQERDFFYNSIEMPIRKKYGILKNAYRFVSKVSIARKMRIPALMVYIYKVIL